MVTHFYGFFLSTLLVCGLGSPSFAEGTRNSDKATDTNVTLTAGLLNEWVETLKHDPNTASFESTGTAGVYYIDTAVLPYKGRVKVLNIFIDNYTPIAEYDKQIAYGGIIETELLDAPKSLAENQPFSFRRWQRMGWFDYDVTTHHWFPFNDWDKHFPPSSRRENGRRPNSSAPPI